MTKDLIRRSEALEQPLGIAASKTGNAAQSDPPYLRPGRDLVDLRRAGALRA